MNPDKHSVDLNDYRIDLRGYDVTRVIERLTRPTALEHSSPPHRSCGATGPSSTHCHPDGW